MAHWCSGRRTVDTWYMICSNRRKIRISISFFYRQTDELIDGFGEVLTAWFLYSLPKLLWECFNRRTWFENVHSNFGRVERQHAVILFLDALKAEYHVPELQMKVSLCRSLVESWLSMEKKLNGKINFKSLTFRCCGWRHWHYMTGSVISIIDFT